MQVILKKDIEKLGYADEIVDVRPGYANNYLIPQGYAISATASAKKVLAETLKQRAHKEAKLVADAEALAAKLAETALTIAAKAEEGRIFGSVTAADLAAALEKLDITVDRKNISLDAVKTIGEYEAKVKIYKGISGTIKFSVVAEEA
jgi:large subunit ribosomal protein L9